MFVNSYLGICNVCECYFSSAACIHEMRDVDSNDWYAYVFL